MNYEQLKYFWENKVPLVWNDPDPQPDANYRICGIFGWDKLHELYEAYGTLEDVPILIHYGENEDGENSEAEVWLHEIGLDFCDIIDGQEQSLEVAEIIELMKDKYIYPCDNCKAFHIDPDVTWDTFDKVLLDMKLERMKLSIDGESVGIYIDNGEDEEPTHVVYWHIEEVEEDADVAIAMVNAVNLFHTNKKELLQKIGMVK